MSLGAATARSGVGAAALWIAPFARALLYSTRVNAVHIPARDSVPITTAATPTRGSARATKLPTRPACAVACDAITGPP